MRVAVDLLSPARWGGRRRARVPDIAAGIVLAAVLWYSVAYFGVAAVEIATGRIADEGRFGGGPPTGMPVLLEYGGMALCVGAPAGIAYALWMLGRGWHWAISLGAVLVGAASCLWTGYSAFVLGLIYSPARWVVVPVGVLAAIVTGLLLDAIAARPSRPAPPRRSPPVEESGIDALLWSGPSIRDSSTSSTS